MGLLIAMQVSGPVFVAASQLLVAVVHASAAH